MLHLGNQHEAQQLENDVTDNSNIEQLTAIVISYWLSTRSSETKLNGCHPKLIQDDNKSKT